MYSQGIYYAPASPHLGGISSSSNANQVAYHHHHHHHQQQQHQLPHHMPHRPPHLQLHHHPHSMHNPHSNNMTPVTPLDLAYSQSMLPSNLLVSSPYFPSPASMVPMSPMTGAPPPPNNSSNTNNNNNNNTNNISSDGGTGYYQQQPSQYPFHPHLHQQSQSHLHHSSRSPYLTSLPSNSNLDQLNLSRTIILRGLNNDLSLSQLLDEIDYGPIEYCKMISKPAPNHLKDVEFLKTCHISFVNSKISVNFHLKYAKNAHNLNNLKNRLQNSKYLKVSLNDNPQSQNGNNTGHNQDFIKLKTLNYILDFNATRCILIKVTTATATATATTPDDQSLSKMLESELYSQCLKFGDIEDFKLNLNAANHEFKILIHFTSIDAAIKTYEYYLKRIQLDKQYQIDHEGFEEANESTESAELNKPADSAESSEHDVNIKPKNNKNKSFSKRRQQSPFKFNFVSFHKDRCDRTVIDKVRKQSQPQSRRVSSSSTINSIAASPAFTRRPLNLSSSSVSASASSASASASVSGSTSPLAQDRDQQVHPRSIPEDVEEHDHDHKGVSLSPRTNATTGVDEDTSSNIGLGVNGGDDLVDVISDDDDDDDVDEANSTTNLSVLSSTNNLLPPSFPHSQIDTHHIMYRSPSYPGAPPPLSSSQFSLIALNNGTTHPGAATMLSSNGGYDEPHSMNHTNPNPIPGVGSGFSYNPDPFNVGNRTIYLGNLHPNTTIEEIANNVRAGGLVEQIKYHPEKKVCFITFIDPNVALKFYLNHQVLHQLIIHGYDITVGWAKNHSGPLNREICLAVTAGASRNVYIGIKLIKDVNGSTATKKQHQEEVKRKIQLPNEDHLRQDFSKFGELEQINFYHNKDCGFINFLNIWDAIKMVELFETNNENKINKITGDDGFYNRYKDFKISFAKDRCGNPPKFSFKKKLNANGGSSFGQGSSIMDNTEYNKFKSNRNRHAKKSQQQQGHSKKMNESKAKEKSDYDKPTRDSGEHEEDDAKISGNEETINEEAAMVFGIISGQHDEHENGHMSNSNGTAPRNVIEEERERESRKASASSQIDEDGPIDNENGNELKEWELERAAKKGTDNEVKNNDAKKNDNNEDDDDGDDDDDDDEEDDDDDDVSIIIGSDDTSSTTAYNSNREYKKKNTSTHGSDLYNNKMPGKNRKNDANANRRNSRNSSTVSLNSNYAKYYNPNQANAPPLPQYQASPYLHHQPMFPAHPSMGHQVYYIPAHSNSRPVLQSAPSGYGAYPYTSGGPQNLPPPPPQFQARHSFSQTPSSHLQNTHLSSGSQVMAQYLAQSQHDNLFYAASILSNDVGADEDGSVYSYKSGGGKSNGGRNNRRKSEIRSE